MPYGFEAFNESGEEVFDFSSVLFEKGTGTATKQTSGNGSLVNFGESQWATSSLDLVAQRYVPNPLGDEGDLTFWKIGTQGIHWSTGLGIPSPSISGVAFGVMTDSSTLLTYKTTSIIDTTPITESYGLKIWNEAGEEIFDSRRKQIGIIDHIIFTQAQADDIMDNDSVIDITLSEASPNCYVCAPFWNNYKQLSTTVCYYIQIAQINSTTLRFSRISKPINTGAPLYYSAPHHAYVSYRHDAVILVAADS